MAFEEGIQGGRRVAVHADVADEDQTVTFPKVETTASDKADGDHQVEAAKTQTVVDQVECTNLVPGKEYTVDGTLRLVADDGTDAGVLSDASGNKVAASKTFTPEAADGYVDLEFTFDASGLVGRKVVAFEELSTAGVRVATHADITDEDQTVEVKTPPATGERLPNTGQDPIALGLVAAGLSTGAYALRRVRRHDNAE